MAAGAGPEHVRLFLALDLPTEARAALAEWRDSVVRGREGLRPLRDEALHVTLAFLGRRPSRQVEPIWETATRSLAGLSAPELAASGSRAVPPRRPRVLAVDLEDRGGRAAAVHEAVSSGLEGGGLFERERRPFWPHVTVARFRPHARLRGGTLPAPPAAGFRTPGVTLYRSDLHPAGARYVALERLELGGHG